MLLTKVGQSNFGKRGTQYDFAGQTLDDLRKKAKDAEAQHKTLKRKVNVKAANMLERSVAGSGFAACFVLTVCEVWRSRKRRCTRIPLLS